MKKIKFYSFASALLLATAAGLGSCASEADTEGGSSQQQNETRDVVKTQFVINIPYANGSSSSNARTRMTDENTQNQKGQNAQYNNFRGIENMILLTFADQPDASSTDANKSTATALCKISTDDNAFAQDNYRRLYRDLQIPVGTKYFILNGCAKRTANETDGTYFTQGRITPNTGYSNTTKLSDLNFNLVPILGTTNNNISDDQTAKEIITQLNNVLKVSADYPYNSITKTTINWKDASSEGNKWGSYMSASEEQFFAERFKRLTTLTAGSVTSVITVLKDLQKILIAGANEENASATDIPDEKVLAKNIYNACATAITEIETKDKVNENSDTKKLFPRNLHLPDGVAKLSYDKEKNEFNYVTSTVTIGATDSNNKIDYTKICYPAELSYFVSTPAMISDKEINKLTDTGLPTYENWLKSTWEANGTFSQATNGVTTSTKSVALKDPVQYSVACLKTTVKCTYTNNGKLEDNASQITATYGASATKANQQIEIPTNGYKLTAILVGGQPAQVDWEFKPTDSDTQGYANTIYDKDMNGTNNESDGQKYIAVTTSSSTANYTLVLDNEVLGDNPTQKSVYVTLEFENNGADFYGAEGLVPHDGKFYLVGLLDPKASSGVSKPKDGTNNEIEIGRVFKKDHTTVANFTITNLKGAYNCIPDLRAAGLNVGLAVDLSWQNGLTFDVNL